MNHEDFQRLILEQFNRVFDELVDINSKVGGLEKRFDGLEGKVGGLEKRFAEIETGLNDKLNLLELVIRNHSAAVDELEGEVDELHIKSRHMQGMLGVHEVEIKLLKDKR